MTLPRRTLLKSLAGALLAPVVWVAKAKAAPVELPTPLAYVVPDPGTMHGYPIKSATLLVRFPGETATRIIGGRRVPNAWAFEGLPDGVELLGVGFGGDSFACQSRFKPSRRKWVAEADA